MHPCMAALADAYVLWAFLLNSSPCKLVKNSLVSEAMAIISSKSDFNRCRHF